ncbi:MAG: hypothetical protein EXR71_00050 [Myxococcales bacterium]|nr:hypothetical protein [Myxococcales bacterium]
MDTRPLEVVVRREGAGFVVHRLDPGMALLQMRPCPLPAILTDVEGGWVLMTPDRSIYLRLGNEERHLWGLIDGRVTVAEMATAYFVRFGALPVGRVIRFVQMLRRAGLVRVEPAGFLRRRFAHVSWLRREWVWGGMHDVAATFWRGIAPFVTPWNGPIALAILGLGATALVADTRVNPAGFGLAAALFAWAFVIHAIVHELAHAVTVVGFGRKVRGVAIGLGGAHVDTTDMYLGSRREHAIVALAGPASNLALVAVAATIGCALPVDALPPFRALIAAGLTAAVMSGWPVLLDNDGAHAVSDLVGIPDLRRASWEALRHGRLGRVHLVYIAGCMVTVLAPPLGLLLAS